MRRPLAALAFLFLALRPLPALAQQTISEFFMGGGGGGQLIFCEDDILALATAARLTDDQKEAARLLMRAAAEKAQRTAVDGYAELSKKHNWEAVYKLPEDQQAVAQAEITAAWARGSIALGKKISEIELEALRDVRSLLTPEQIENAWPRFERFRRRLLVSAGYAWGLGTDPRELVIAAKIDPADLVLAEPILAGHDEAIDVLITRRMSRLTSLMQQMAQNGNIDESGGGWNSPDLMNREITQLNVRTARALEGSLSDAGRQRLIRQRVGAEAGYIISRPSKDLVVQQYLSLPSITSDQKQRMKTIAEAADDQTFDAALALVRANDEATLRSEPEKPEEPQTRTAKAADAAAKVLAGLTKDLRTLLTAEQLDEIDGKQGSRSFEFAFKRRRSSIPISSWTDDEPTTDTTTPTPAVAP